MNRSFAICTKVKEAVLGAERKGKVAFTVTNVTDRAIRGQLNVKPLDSTDPDWLSIDGEKERDFPAKKTLDVNVGVAIPPDVAAGKYTFRLDVFSVVNKDEDYTEGPNFAFEVPAENVQKKPFPWWILAVVVGVLIIISVAIWLFLPGKVTVPNVIGKSVEEAKKTVEEAKLRVETNDQPSVNIPPNQIINQSPEPGNKVDKGSIIQLIVAKTPKTPKTFFNFITNASSATWASRNGVNILPWSGSDGDPRGFALLRSGWRLEDQTIPKQPVLEMHPEWVDFGQINGDFILPSPIQDGDRFKAQVGFLNGAVAGEVTFVISAWSDTPSTLLVVHRENDQASDKALKPLDIDLSPVVGRRIIRLSVEANQSSVQDWAIWLDPRIER